MLISDDRLADLIKGLQKANWSNESTSPLASVNAEDFTENYLSDIIAGSHLKESRVLNQLAEELKSTTFHSRPAYSPLIYSLELLSRNSKTSFYEFFHLCRKHKSFIHPTVLPLLLKQPINTEIKAEILTLASKESQRTINDWQDLYDFKLDTPAGESSSSLKLQWLFHLKTQKSWREFGRDWNGLKTGEKTELLESLPLGNPMFGQFDSMPAFDHPSKKLRKLTLIHTLSQIETSISKDSAAFLTSFFSDGKKEFLPSELEEIQDAIGMPQDKFIKILIAATPPKLWFNQSIAEHLHQNWEGCATLYIKELTQLALRSSHELLLLLLIKNGNASSLKAEIEQLKNSQPKIRIKSPFFNRIAGSLLSSKAEKNIPIIDAMGTIYEGFLPDALTKTLVKKLKDPSFPLLFSEKGIQTGASLCDKIAYSANPLLTEILPAAAMESAFHPLEECFQKIRECWSYRIEMRRAFSREYQATSDARNE